MIYTLVHHILKFKRINSAGDLPTNVHNKFTSPPTNMYKYVGHKGPNKKNKNSHWPTTMKLCVEIGKANFEI